VGVVGIDERQSAATSSAGDTGNRSCKVCPRSMMVALGVGVPPYIGVGGDDQGPDSGLPGWRRCRLGYTPGRPRPAVGGVTAGATPQQQRQRFELPTVRWKPVGRPVNYRNRDGGRISFRPGIRAAQVRRRFPSLVRDDGRSLVGDRAVPVRKSVARARFAKRESDRPARWVDRRGCCRDPRVKLRVPCSAPPRLGDVTQDAAIEEKIGWRLSRTAPMKSGAAGGQGSRRRGRLRESVGPPYVAMPMPLNRRGSQAHRFAGLFQARRAGAGEDCRSSPRRRKLPQRVPLSR